jgi:hypothetical protein
MGQIPTTRADGLRVLREAKWQREQDRQAAELKAARKAKPATIVRAEPAIAGRVSSKRVAKKTRPQGKKR